MQMECRNELMGKKVLCVCNTYFQLLTVIQLKHTLLQNDYVAVLLSDHSKNARQIVRNLKTLNCFEAAGFLETKALDYGGHGLIKKIAGIFQPRPGSLIAGYVCLIRLFLMNLCISIIICQRLQSGSVCTGKIIGLPVPSTKKASFPMTLRQGMEISASCPTG